MAKISRQLIDPTRCTINAPQLAACTSSNHPAQRPAYCPLLSKPRHFSQPPAPNLFAPHRPDKLEIRDDLNLNFLIKGAPCILVLGNPRDPFTSHEFDVLKKFLRHGGSLLVLGNDGGEEKTGTNINYLLEEFGIAINNDSVVS